ncbi:unnamed protein product [Rotaria sordida]|uniref:Anoctamin n=1 Tax=Rotaria sordida TaxID=392033 RepID=A0A814F9S6_9BILA|nr:unnamed protein product [Rotaria sordida]CAF3607858.1 unnamed protein product [Rotaria sordida]
MIWATGFLIFWRRRQAEIAYQWNTLDMEPIEEIRSTFKGQLHRSPVTGKLEVYYPNWKRLLFRLLVTIPMIGINIMLVSFVILLIIRFQSWIDRQLKIGRLPHLMSLTEFLPKILLALVTTIFSDIYKRIARWLTNQENYREQRVHDDQMIAKLFACSCVNSYFSVFYIAFFTHKYIRLSHQLTTIFVMKQFWGNIKEAIIPYIISNTHLSVLIQMSKKGRIRYAERKDLNKELKRILDDWENSKLNTTKQRKDNHDYTTKAVDDILTDNSLNHRSSTSTFETLSLSQAEIECSQPKWTDLYEDYLEMVVQFGYIIFLSTLFPLAAFFSLLNNLIEIRTDAFKLCMIYQRPFSQRVKDIGQWQIIMEYMVYAAIIINCIFCSTRGVFRRLIPDLPFGGEIFVLVCIEHALILFCKIIRSSFEEVPYWVRIEKAKMEYRRRQALKKLECDTLLHRKDSRCHAPNE